MSAIKMLDVFICSVGSTATFQTPSGIYTYHIDRCLAEYVKQRGRHQPGKMLNVVKIRCYKVDKSEEKLQSS